MSVVGSNIFRSRWTVALSMLVSAFMIVLSSCHSEYCRENMYITANVYIYHFQQPSNRLALQGLKVSAVDEADNVVSTIYSDTTLNTLKLELNPLSDTSRFRISSNLLNETLVIVHRSETEFVSAECGCRNVAIIESAYMDNIGNRDSIAINDFKVDEMYDNENIKIYLFIE